MGLFDWLFGKKKRESNSTRQNSYKPEEKDDFDVQKLLDMGREKESNKQPTEWEKKKAKIKEAVAACPGSERYYLEKGQAESNAHIMGITEFTPVLKSRFVAFDLETTGLDSVEDAIIEIGACRVENGVITETYQQLVNPDKPISPEASAVNHITDSMVKDKPFIYQVLPSFLNFVGDDVLASHNVRFDYKFLAQACLRNQFRVPELLFDSMTMAKYYPECTSKKLTALVDAAGIEQEEAHRALGDAIMVSKLIMAAHKKRNQKKPKAKPSQEKAAQGEETQK